jgi:hypothetical protein
MPRAASDTFFLVADVGWASGMRYARSVRLIGDQRYAETVEAMRIADADAPLTRVSVGVLPVAEGSGKENLRAG